MSLDVKVGVRASGALDSLTREQKEQQGLVPAPVRFDGVPPLRWCEFRLVAEIGGVNELAEAKQMADAAKRAGFWAVKVQMLDRYALTTRTAVRYDAPGLQWDVFDGHGLDYWDLKALKEHCDSLGLLLFASCWDEDMVDWALKLGFPLIKIGSGDITHEWLLRYIGKCGVPVILSTGASYGWEIDQALEWLGEAPQIVLAACTLSYPTSPQDAHLSRIRTLSQAYPHCLVGYSDHCAEPWIVGEAKRAGATFVEAHWTVTPGAGGDHDFALHPGNIEHVFDPPDGWNGDHHGDPRLQPCEAELPARAGARRSLATNVPVAKGERIRPWDLRALRPGTGVEPYRVQDVVGRPALRDYEAGELLDPFEGV
jgi:sialic acid synthase SpsE